MRNQKGSKRKTFLRLTKRNPTEAELAKLTPDARLMLQVLQDAADERTCRCSDEMGKQETEKMNAAIIAALGFLAGFAGVLIWRLSKRTTK